MKVQGFSDAEVSALILAWGLGDPIDVEAFLDRLDVPFGAKERVAEVGVRAGGRRQARAETLMREQIVHELDGLRKPEAKSQGNAR